MTDILEPTALVEFDGEPRIQDLELGIRLGFERPRKIRDLIRAHTAELQRYGNLPQVRAKSSPSGKGRPAMEYWLNECQALLVCIWSETESAADVRQQVVTVFQAVRTGKLAPPIRRTDRLMELRFQEVQAQMAQLTALVMRLGGFDPSIQQTVSFRPAVWFLINEGVPQKKRRPLVVRCSKRLLRFAFIQNKANLVRPDNDDSGRWLFHLDLFAEWKGVEGAEIIRAHKERTANQSVMQFTVVPKSPPTEAI